MNEERRPTWRFRDSLAVAVGYYIAAKLFLPDDLAFVPALAIGIAAGFLAGVIIGIGRRLR